MADLLTIEEARRAGPGDGVTHHDDDLKIIVAGISTRIDQLCGPVVARQITDERHDGGRPRIFLDELHASGVTVVEWSGTVQTPLDPETPGVVPDDGFLLDGSGGLAWLWRRRAGSDARFASGRRNIVVAYTAGRYESTVTVGEHFKLAASSVIRRVWKRESEAWAQSADFFPSVEDPSGQARFAGFFRAVKPVVDEFLGDELRPPAAA